MYADTPEQIAQDIADIHSLYMDDYAEHAFSEPTYEDIAEMHMWAEDADDYADMAV